MLGSKQVLAYDDASKAFVGVRFLLLGFNSINKDKVRSKLLEGGGIDAVNYGSDCTHVIVDKLVYDEPICVAARRDGKTLVTGLWVDHSFDVGMPVDPTSVMYRPMRDLNGISGAKSLVVCLTGYQRQDRDDIMTMVALMGANFSKPLVANKVTHLICYKFEGEKYELAKKMKKIKLVNHLWLEDCLKAWEILLEVDYCKSGYELEMEAEAKDSEEETEDIASILDVVKKKAVSPQNTRAENKNSHQSPELVRNSLNLSAAKCLGNIGDISKIQTTPLKNTDFRKPSFSQETHFDMPISFSSRNPGKLSSEVISEQVENVSTSASESAKKSHNADLSKSSYSSSPGKASLPLRSERIENNSGSPSALNVNKLRVSGGFDMHVETHRDATDLNGVNEEASLAPKEDLNISVVSEDKQEENDEALQHSRVGLKKRLLPNLDIKDLSSSRTDNSTGGVGVHQSDEQITERKLDGRVDLNVANVGSTGPTVKPLKSKMLAKKTLGSRPMLSKGSTAKHKGSLNLQNLQNEHIIYSIGGTDTDKSQRTQMNNLRGSQSEATDVNGPVNETKAPEDKGLFDFEPQSDEEKYDEVEAPHSGDNSKDKRVGVVHKKKKFDGKKLAKSVENEKDNEAQKAVDKTELAESKSTVGEKKLTKGKKRRSTKSMTNKWKDPREDAEKDVSNSKRDENKTVSGNEEETVILAGKTKTRPSKKLKCSNDIEKEQNHESVSNDAGAAGKFSSQPLKSPLKNGLKTEKARSDSPIKAQNIEVKTEPAWFILSGHKLQRKEFQQVIRRLKGRVCRDSHNWSYQATHFIVPDPIRRTEKFFAAAASGSWILKTDYLKASNEAGRFLSEDPYEWHKKCLTEDGAINLEAPRKWRLLREKTGRGAFYGMRIVIYGECIAPPLDTLKRAVKAGDGTILATSPPYTRFLQSKIDFAIVSPGMPRVDMWVQEFLRHEVPCVVADYLVEYVCKPGYSLEGHVQYNTHAWAKKSLENLINRVEEVVEDVRTPEDCSIDDVVCQVCGCRDRGEEMLLCGDETGTCGCGAGIHLDCLDPPLEAIPKEDWFCQKCSKKRAGRSISKSSNKRASKSKK
ncbi:hypothetical protein BUALT_Bualt02G0240900 [Buddleja alternifolia]|uniref:BRCT domain-containing protein n=1 Tax=Buddleja alternifolia TaxID=168488 RepID=A0AAV6YDX5_9LAMI|nr:hypothetical protein BUALT_Bualt02G0240900 [Buddleja alternifolia]